MGTEVDPKVSRGHEFQGVDEFRKFLGAVPEKISIPVTYLWLSDDAPPFSLGLKGTWYDSRRGKAGRSEEYRLYYPKGAEEVVYRAGAGDTLFLCLQKDGSLLAMLCPGGSSIEQQLLWLFGLDLLAGKDMVPRDFREGASTELGIAARYVLDLIGIEAEDSDDSCLERLLEKFGDSFPSTAVFSKFARETFEDVSASENPDAALMAWMNYEEQLFRTLERHLVGDRLQEGFVVNGRPDVDSFLSYSLSVQNRRKSRVGYGLENHLEEIFRVNGLKFERGAETENRSKPDFLFPGIAEYSDPEYDASRLTMLGSKSTCKDRWRQVLSEAKRIPEKHLITLEPGISENQTKEMQANSLQLVLPEELHDSFQKSQRGGLINLGEFIELARQRESLDR